MSHEAVAYLRDSHRERETGCVGDQQQVQSDDQRTIPTSNSVVPHRFRNSSIIDSRVENHNSWRVSYTSETPAD